MTADTLISHLRQLGIPATVSIEPGDRAYALPDLDTVSGAFSRAWREDMLDLNLQFQGEAEDCDDYARLCACYAELYHARTPGRPRNTALAFGSVWYRRDVGGGHAVNFFLTTQNQYAALKFYEPQTARLLNLSDTELESITRVNL